MRASSPKCFGLGECRGECSWFGARKASVAIIQKNRYGPSEPCGGKNQVNGVISIHVARLDPQAAGRRDKLNGLLPRGGQLEVNPIGACVGGAVSVLDAGEVRAKIAVKISNGEC